MQRRPAGPLSHLTVIDLTQFLSGPYATQILGDMGARVIKIEPPEGEMTHTVPPHFIKGESAYYLSVNRNKENVVIDLKKPEGQALLYKLVANADMLVENFRPGVGPRLGVEFDKLHAVNPRLVMCSISGFGQDGPYRNRPAYDIIVQAISGGMSMTGEDEGKPVRTGIPVGDLAAGMYGVIGALAAYAEAQRTGIGRQIDVSMLDCQVSMLSYQAAYHLFNGEVPGTQGRGHRSIPTYRAYLCRDGIEIVVAANTERMWKSLCEVLDKHHLVDDPRFIINADRLNNRAALDALLEPAFAQIDSSAAITRLNEAGVPSGPINNLEHALSDPQVVHRDMVIKLEDEQGDAVRVAGNPVKISGYPTDRHAYPVKQGSDTAAVLRELAGLDDSALAALIKQGIVKEAV